MPINHHIHHLPKTFKLNYAFISQKKKSSIIFTMFYEYLTSNIVINERQVYERKTEFSELLNKLRYQGKLHNRFRMSKMHFNVQFRFLEPYMDAIRDFRGRKIPCLLTLSLQQGKGYTIHNISSSSLGPRISGILKFILFPSTECFGDFNLSRNHNASIPH